MVANTIAYSCLPAAAEQNKKKTVENRQFLDLFPVFFERARGGCYDLNDMYVDNF